MIKKIAIFTTALLLSSQVSYAEMKAVILKSDFINYNTPNDGDNGGINFGVAPKFKKTFTGYFATFGITDDNRVFVSGGLWSGVGASWANDIPVFKELTELRDKNIVAIESGTSHSLALDADGTLWLTGDDRDGQFGGTSGSAGKWIKTNITNVKDIAVNDDRSFYIDQTGQLWATGSNKHYSLGINSSSTSNVNSWTATNVTNAVQVSAGYQLTYAVDSDGHVWGAGDNSDGALGQGNTNVYYNFQQSTNITNAVKVEAGYDFAIAIDSNGDLWGVGSNYDGEAGLENAQAYSTWTKSTSNIKAKDISAGQMHSLMLDQSNNMFISGYNDNGPLGTEVNGSIIGWTLHPVLLTNFTFQSIDGGEWHSSAVSNNGIMLTSGQNSSGQLGTDASIGVDINKWVSINEDALIDTDGDGYVDYLESKHGTDLNDENDFPSCQAHPGSGSGNGDGSGDSSCYN